MAPSLDLTAADTPSEPFWPEPPGAFQTLSWSKDQSEAAVLLRYLVKLSVVPELSERCTARIGEGGRVTPALSALMVASSHFVILPEKILARVAGENCRLLAPLTFVTTAIGPITIGRWIAWLPPPQRWSAPGFSVSLRAESEPAKSAVPAVKAWIPAPEPVTW